MINEPIKRQPQKPEVIELGPLSGILIIGVEVHPRATHVSIKGAIAALSFQPLARARPSSDSDPPPTHNGALRA